MGSCTGCHILRCDLEAADREMRRVRERSSVEMTTAHKRIAALTAENEGLKEKLAQYERVDAMGADVRNRLRAENSALTAALTALWRYVNAECGDWWMRADRRAIALKVDAALSAGGAVPRAGGEEG